MAILKRRRFAHAFSPAQMLQMLKQETNLVALLQHNAVWLPADPRTVWVLDMCCKGQLEGGPAMGQQIASTLGLVLPPPPAQPQPQEPATTSAGPQPSAAPNSTQAQATDTQPQPPPGTAEAPQGSPAAAGQVHIHEARDHDLMDTDQPVALSPPPQDTAMRPEEPTAPQRPGAEEGQGTEGQGGPDAALGQDGEGDDLVWAASDSEEGADMSEDCEGIEEGDEVSEQQGQQDHQQDTEMAATGGAAQDADLVWDASDEEQGGTQQGVSDTQQGARTQQGSKEGEQAASAAAAAPRGMSFAEHQAAAARIRAQQQRAARPAGGRGGAGAGGRGGSRRPADERAYVPWSSRTHQWNCVRLTLEETFFLQHVLKCLRVKTVSVSDPRLASQPQHQQHIDNEVKELNDQELWDALRTIRPNFPTSYVGYHHLKCKGWLPRSGLLYGVDYVAYHLHPLAAHSLFAVLLQPIQPLHTPTQTTPHTAEQAQTVSLQPIQPTQGVAVCTTTPTPTQTAPHSAGQALPTDPTASAGGPMPTQQQGQLSVGGQALLQGGNGNGGGGLEAQPGSYPMSWLDFQITTRVVGTVGKRLLILYLYEAPSSPGRHTPECIQHFQVEERVVRRWVPAATRD